MFAPLGFLDILNFQGILVLAILGVLLYGERLPEVAASLGKQLLQLKKSFQGIRSEFESALHNTTSSAKETFERAQYSPVEEATAPKFEPPPAEPEIEPSSSPKAVAETSSSHV